jgi:hypothetical protein
MRRVAWFTAGAVSGAVGAAWTYVRVRELRDRATADGLADTVVDVTRKVGRGAGNRVRASVTEGVATMRETRANLLSDVDDSQ